MQPICLHAKQHVLSSLDMLYGTATPDWRTLPHRNVSESRQRSFETAQARFPSFHILPSPIFMSNHGTIRETVRTILTMHGCMVTVTLCLFSS